MIVRYEMVKENKYNRERVREMRPNLIIIYKSKKMFLNINKIVLGFIFCMYFYILIRSKLK